MELSNSKSLISSKNITNFFKGIAILMVFLVHSHQRFNLSFSQNVIQRFGQMGCQIFFVLSSFGLCYSFSNGIPKWLSYIKKRLSSLAIGWWIAILLSAVYRILMAIVIDKDILQELNFPGIIVNVFFLNGLVPVYGINNNIVRGGWYVGTTVILYGIFPLLYKLYYECKSEKWIKYRALVFPIIIFIVASFLVIILGKIHPKFICYNNSFIYFSFINQLTPFSLGLVLFDVCHRFKKNNYALWLSIFLFLVSIFLFYSNWQYSFVFCQSFVALAFMFLCLFTLTNNYTYNKINNQNNIIIKTICNFGTLSFPIFLTHSFIVYDFSLVCLKILRHISSNDFLWYLVLLPIELCLVYVVGYIYNKCILLIKKIISKK